jgi:hypothetical protein
MSELIDAYGRGEQLIESTFAPSEEEIRKISN